MVVQKKIPLRKCVATGEMIAKKEMIRIVRSKEGEVSVDLTGKKSGRGAYVSKTIEAINKAKKKNSLGNHLEVAIPTEIYDELIVIIEREKLK